MARIVITSRDGEVFYDQDIYIDSNDRAATLEQSTIDKVTDAAWNACRRDMENFRRAVRESGLMHVDQLSDAISNEGLTTEAKGGKVSS